MKVTKEVIGSVCWVYFQAHPNADTEETEPVSEWH